jgi:hypothetical protein
MLTSKKVGETVKPSVSKKSDWKHKSRLFAKYFLVPALIYSAIFFITSPAYLTKFSTYFYNDGGDGFQNVWNIWWVNRALTVTHQNPWSTGMIHWPHGVSLLPQTMNVFNGLMAIPFIHILKFNLIQAYNLAMVVSFVMGGVTMFWLIQKWFKVYWVAIIAGIMYTFSSYHFSHGLGHLQLISLEWIPLFILAFWNMVERLRYRDAILAAGALLLVALCDYYYLVYCVILGAMWLVWCLYKKQLKINKHNLLVFSTFAAICMITFGPLLVGLMVLNHFDPLLGFHDPVMFSMDIISPFLPGGSWWWSSLTARHWTRLAYYAEMNVFFGYTLLGLLAVGFYWLVRKVKVNAPKWLNFWWIVLIVFGVMSLGPYLSVFGHHFTQVPLPYKVLEKVLPTLKISGMPVRWIIMSQIAAIIIGSFVMTKINPKTHKGKIILILGTLLLIVEMRPHPLPLTSPAYLPYVDFLKTQPAGALLDNGPVSAPHQLYYQTIHERPIAFGYTTRLPRSTDSKDFLIFEALETGKYDKLCRDFKIRFVVTRVNYPMEFPTIYRDNTPENVHIYDVKNSDNC